MDLMRFSYRIITQSAHPQAYACNGGILGGAQWYFVCRQVSLIPGTDHHFTASVCFYLHVVGGKSQRNSYKVILVWRPGLWTWYRSVAEIQLCPLCPDNGVAAASLWCITSLRVDTGVLATPIIALASASHPRHSTWKWRGWNVIESRTWRPFCSQT